MPRRDSSIAGLIPHGCQRIVGARRFTSSDFVARYCVDYGVLIEGRSVLGEQRCLPAVQSSATGRVRYLADRGPRNPPLLSRESMYFQTRLKTLGWVLDTQLVTVNACARTAVRVSSRSGLRANDRNGQGGVRDDCYLIRARLF